MSATPDGDDAALLALRTQIDSVDRELLALLNRRAGLALQVGELKKHTGGVVFRPEREAQVIDGLKAANAGPLQSDSVAPIWREIMSACRALERRIRVAYLGPAGTFSEEAALGYFGSSIERVPCTSFDEVFHSTSGGAADFGVVPVENSTEGVVARSLDLLLHTPLFIVGETSLFVRHNLLRREPSLDGIQTVLAHPQALAQCNAWLSQHLPQAERRAGAEQCRRRAPGGAGRVAGRDRQRARRQRIRPAHRGAGDPGRCATTARALPSSPIPSRHPAPKPSGHDCTSLVVSVDNRPGAVHDMLVPLKAHGVSMTRFESRPARSGQWEYYFYVDLEGHPDQPHVAAALRELRAVCAFFKVLGTYPVDVH